MKQLMMLLAIGMILSANKCKEGGDGKASLLDRKWVFQSVGGSALKMPDGAEQPWVQLTADGLQGFGGCNRLMGTYELAGERLSFPGVGSTKMYCENTQRIEDEIKSTLGRVDNFKLEGRDLKLQQGSTHLATLRAE